MRVFDKVALELLAEEASSGSSGGPPIRIYVAYAPFASHGGVLYRWKDWVDMWREFGAIKYYRARGFIDGE